MMGRLLRVSGSVLVIAVAFVTPVLATATATPASADTVVNGCTIVSNPTSTNFTNCPGVDLTGASLSGVDLSFADLAGATFVDCNFFAVSCTGTDLTGANLTDANLSNAVLFSFTTAPPPFHGGASATANLSNANLSGADLSGADAQGVSFRGANLTDVNFTNANLAAAGLAGAMFPGADFTGTDLVPQSLTETATSGAGAVATWMLLVGVSGVMSESCNPAPGSTFPVGTTTVTCQFVDDFGGVATGTFVVTVEATRVLVPSDGAFLSGAAVLDASAVDAAGITSVVFEVSGGTLSDQVVATATPTLFGWVAKWNTTSVPSGTYSLQSVATDTADSVQTSNPITVTVNNQPKTAVLIPSQDFDVITGAQSLLDASASSPAFGIASVTFELSGNGLTNQVVATGTPTIYGYLAQWNTFTVPDGTFTLQSVATDTMGQSTTSAEVIVNVGNSSPSTAVLIPTGGATQSGTAALLDASASPGVTSVTFEVSGNGLTNQVVATGTPTLYGWLARWNTTSVPNGTYQLTSVASYAGGLSGTSFPSITITVSN
jgi:uncharacterized protein YjbI with pentapeptide repeats